jgi:hypothetical protein
MISLKRTTIPLELVLLAILAALCHGAEPTEKSQLKYLFESSPVSRTQKKTAQPTILPTHSASFNLEWYHRIPSEPHMNSVLQTTAGKSISQLQREFIKTTGNMTSKQAVSSSRRTLLGMEYSSGRILYELHAVSKEDARKMAEAFTEVLLKENNAALKPQLDKFLGTFQVERAEYLQDIEDIRQKTPVKERELKDLRAKFADLRKGRWYQSTDQAKKAMLELNTILNTESIELAGLLAKRKAIEKHRSDVEHKVKNRSTVMIRRWEPILISLEQKYIDLMIDLDVAKAREETALTLRGQAQAFLDLSDRMNQVDHEVSRLEPDLSRSESNLASLEKLLAQPKPPMLPLQIHRNEVKIRPVTVKLAE